MTIINIPKNKAVGDKHYRYRRETVELKIEGKGNGFKTVITNLKSVSASLGIPIFYPLKYFSLELAAHTKIDKNDKVIINGKFNVDSVEDVLEKFIDHFLLCKECHLPELDFHVKSNKDPILTTCRSCGHSEQVDSTEKLYTTIVKHPPKSKGFKEVNPVDVVPVESQQGITNVIDEKVSIDDGTWSLDISQEAVKKRREMEGLSEKFRELTKGMDEEDDEEEVQTVSPVSVLKQFMEIVPNASNTQIYQATRKLKTDYSLTDKECVCLIYETFFTPENIMTDISKRAPLFQAFNSSSGQKLILGYTEELVGLKKPSLVRHTSAILHEFYQNSLVSKENMEEWLSKKKSRFVKDSALVTKIKEAAKPFGEWIMLN